MYRQSININVVDVPKYIPEFVEIKYSKIPNAGLGIFARTKIKAGTFLGNYMGEIIEDEKQIPVTDYLYRSNRYNKEFWMDAIDMEKSNYTRFLNCCSSSQVGTENVYTIRYTDETKPSVFTTSNGKQIDIQGYIFMYAARDIEEGEELMYNYGEKYRKKLGI